MALNEFERFKSTLETSQQLLNLKSKENETKCRRQKLQKQSEKAERGEPFEDAPSREQKPRLGKQHASYVHEKGSGTRHRDSESWKICERLDQLTEENRRKKLDISRLRREHEVARCRGTACYDYEDAVASFGVTLRNHVGRARRATVSPDALDELVRQEVQEKVVSMLLLSELVYLYKQFRPHPASLVPVEFKRAPLEKVILSEFTQAKSRVKALASQYRNTAKDLRLAEEEETEPTASTARMEPPPVRKAAAKEGPRRKSPAEVKQEERGPLIPPQILKIVEDDLLQRIRVAEEHVSGKAKKQSGPSEYACSERGERDSDTLSQFRRPVRQVKRNK